jgi:DNA-binding beta-propeller fold protein YncE
MNGTDKTMNTNTRMMNGRFAVVAMLLMLAFALALPNTASAGDKKKANKNIAPAAKQQKKVLRPEDIDASKLVWPRPPDVARIKYVTFLTGDKIEQEAKKIKPKTTWMDRLAGSPPPADDKNVKIPFQLIAPYGLAVDSKGRVYAADQRVGAIFIFNTETKEMEMIRNKYEASFKLLNGLAMDDNDRLFVADGDLHHVLVFNAQHKQEDVIIEGMQHPVGVAIDKENRLLYVADSVLDQVLVYDADSFKLLRKIGKTGHNHELTSPGDFANPTNVAVDSDGNLYVADTLNDRVEIFDGDGKFISTFGKNCDAPGCFQRPKGIAVDADNHIWVVDTLASRVQVFNKEGQLLAYFGEYGKLPGQFNAASGIAIDKFNRVIVSEQQPGRLQIFRYVTETEAAEVKKQQETDRLAKAGRGEEAKSGQASADTRTTKSSEPAVSKGPSR